MGATAIHEPAPTPLLVAERPGPRDGAPEPAVSVLIADSDRAVSYSLWALLRWQPGIRVAATAESPAQALTLARRRRPDVCLVSAALGSGEGIRLAHRLTLLPLAPTVLVYADEPGPELAATAVIAGAAGAVSRYGDPDELAGAIRRAAAGEQKPPELPAGTLTALLDQVADSDRSLASMLLLGFSRDEIARTLGIGARRLHARWCELVKQLAARPVAAPSARAGAGAPGWRITARGGLR